MLSLSKPAGGGWISEYWWRFSTGRDPYQGAWPNSVAAGRKGRTVRWPVNARR
jgi:hypothetical protein